MAAAVLTTTPVYTGASTVKDVPGCGLCHGSGMEIRHFADGYTVQRCDFLHSQEAAWRASSAWTDP